MLGVPCGRKGCVTGVTFARTRMCTWQIPDKLYILHADTGQRQPAGRPVWAGQLPAAASITVQHTQQVLNKPQLMRCRT